jgi:hypothetical protein
LLTIKGNERCGFKLSDDCVNGTSLFGRERFPIFAILSPAVIYHPVIEVLAGRSK